MLKWCRLPLKVLHRNNAIDRTGMAALVKERVAEKGGNELIPAPCLEQETYVTCPIYYASGPPHIGHLHSSVVGDFYHRWFKLLHLKSHFSTGTDEHGTKIIKTYNLNKFKYDSIEDFVGTMSKQYEEQFNQVNLSNDYFTRTTSKKHSKVATKMWEKIKHKITKEDFAGWYSYNDEEFVTLGNQLIEGEKHYSKESGHQLEFIEESNYFFRFDEYLDDIELYIRTAVCTENRKPLLTQIQEFRENPESAKICLSRPNARMRVNSPHTEAQVWGVPVPDEDGKHRMYVWFEALCSYVTAIYNAPNKNYPETYKNVIWPPTMQVIGVDIAKFHCIYFPAILLAAGMELPKSVFIHGHWTNAGEKMGKSKANYVMLEDMMAVVNGQVDGVRWFLLNNVSEYNKNYSTDLLRIQTDQALGRHIAQLFEKATSHAQNPFQTYPHLHPEKLPEMEMVEELLGTIKSLPADYAQHVHNGRPSRALMSVIERLKVVGKFMEKNRLDDIDRNDLDQRYFADSVNHVIYESIRVCAILLQPAIPQTATKILNRFGIPLESRFFDDAEDNFSILEEDGIAFERAGRNLGPGQGKTYKFDYIAKKEAAFVQHLEERQLMAQEKMLNSKTVSVVENKVKQKRRAKVQVARKRKKLEKKAQRRRDGLEGLEGF